MSPIRAADPTWWWPPTLIGICVDRAGGHPRHATEDGLERTFALNHLAPFLLTNLLLEHLMRGDAARVDTVSSDAQAMGRIDFDDLQGRNSQYLWIGVLRDLLITS